MNKKLALIYFLFFGLLFFTFYLLPKTARAAAAVPAPVPFDCNKVSDTEFSSDRPYQASVCGDRPVSYWCGNDVVINLGTIHTPYCDPKGGQATICPCKGLKCDHTGDNKQTIDVDLTNVQLPILGNTQLTKNSGSSADQIDDGTKTSNYVAWYLGGTNDKAEYGYTDPATSAGLSKIVDSSGPLKKLLPSIIQDAVRLNSINAASQQDTYSTDTEGEPKAVSQQVSENQTHNQIVVCANKNNAGIFTGLLDLLSLGKYTPADCYLGNGSSAKGDKVLRLKNWSDDKLGFNVLANSFVNAAITGLKLIYPFVPAGAIETSIGNHWTYARPPLPWDDGTGKAFATDAEYQKAYYEWRGNACAIIPLINKVVCVGNVFVPSLYADLYPYVPLANTTDKQGAQPVKNVHVDHPNVPDGSFICPGGICYVIIHSPTLRLAHSLEDFQLTNTLKSTYTPGQTADQAAAAASVTAVPGDVEQNAAPNCRIIPSRTNPGDDATFSNLQSHIQVDVQYQVTEIECSTPQWVGPEETGRRGPENTGRSRTVPGHWDANCSTTIYATVDSVSKTAYADEIWNNTVAGTDSIFRRIYPKTGAGAPVSCIADTPASSNATYTLNSNSSNGLELVRVIEPDGSAVQSADGKTADAQLYYPHYGGVLDYFLNGIQQALRPKGFGPGTPVNGQFCNNLLCGDLPKDLPKASGSCNLGSTSGLNVPNSLKQILEAAGQTYHVPPSLILGVMFGESAFEKGRFTWTDTNVKNWASCVPLPNCSQGGNVIKSVVEFQSGIWANLAEKILPDLQKLDPKKTQADPCNLLDAVYGLAKDLHDDAGGFGAANNICFGVKMSSTNPTDCSWQNDQYVTAIKEWETGGEASCYSRKGSCYLGNSIPPCPLNTSDPNCDTLQNRSSDTSVNSHMACVFNIATGGGSGNKQ